MSVTIAGGPQVLPGVPQLMTFPDPAVGTDFSTTVPAGQWWRVWGGSCHVAPGVTNINRTPTFEAYYGTTKIYVASNDANYNTGGSQTVVFHDQHAALNITTPVLTGAGETWSTLTNPPSLVYQPIGLRSIWLPPGTTIHYYMYLIQADDQVSNVSMLVEVATSPPAGAGSIRTVASPAAGSGWTTTVPAGEAWRVWGGSAKITTDATVASRVPYWLATTSEGSVVNCGLTVNGTSASHTHTACYNELGMVNDDQWIAQFIPCPRKAVWLPSGTVIQGGWVNIQAGDQVSEVGLLVESVKS